jgi:hypothetical protein
MNASPIRIFIDCEFTDFIDMNLISLACVTKDGSEYYAEVEDYPADSCNDFVRGVVLSLLGRIPGAMRSRTQLRESLLQWLDDVRDGQNVLVSYDYFGDWALLIEALDGDETPTWLRPDNVRDQIDVCARSEYYARAGEPEHHALYDARALCHAYRPH